MLCLRNFLPKFKGFLLGWFDLNIDWLNYFKLFHWLLIIIFAKLMCITQMNFELKNRNRITLGFKKKHQEEGKTYFRLVHFYFYSFLTKYKHIKIFQLSHINNCICNAEWNYYVQGNIHLPGHGISFLLLTHDSY